MPMLKEPAVKRRGNRKLLLVLLLLFIILLSVLFFNSPISKISSVTVQGELYTPAADIKEAAGIKVGDAFYGTLSSTIAKRIKELKAVESATITKRFPGEVDIKVKEYPAVAFELSDKGALTAILSSGSTVAVSGDAVVDKPVLSGWRSDDPIKAQLCKELAGIGGKEIEDLSEIMPFPSNAYPDRIKIYTRTGFEVITAASLLKDKISSLNAVVEEQEPGRITMLLADTYVPFHPLQDDGEQNAPDIE
ncbi:cell division protein DivIB [Paenibacillus beijingensis]|uniref:Cell division protein DivIB n=2 Tax=Paenibacillus beijingensis TaxID=1126833 RepID=A0A0D5NRT3_9BACL|nr:cell division protein DivIB [Paenibacillus beijingensis]